MIATKMIATKSGLNIENLASDFGRMQDIRQLSVLHFEDSQEKRFSKSISQYDRIYPFTTENLQGYMPLLALTGKSVLTVGSSGDHIINAALLGARSITAFDINVLAALYSELKCIALQILEFDEYKEFFFRSDDTKEKALRFETYAHLRDNLSSMTQAFFDSKYSDFGNKGHFFRESSVFQTAYDSADLNIKCNPYLQTKEQYEKVRARMQEMECQWLQCAAEDLSTRITDQKFDVILLSNISDYAHRRFPDEENYIGAFVDAIINSANAILTHDGTICAAYIYDVRKAWCPTDKYRTDIDNPKTRNTVFSDCGMDYREECFDSVIEGKQDAVVLLQNNGRLDRMKQATNAHCKSLKTIQ
jgi:hypothetical protein